MNPSDGRILCTRVKHYDSKSLFKDFREEAGQGTSAIAKRKALLLGRHSSRRLPRRHCHTLLLVSCSYTQLARRSGSPSAGILSWTLAPLLSLAFAEIWPATSWVKFYWLF